MKRCATVLKLFALLCIAALGIASLMWPTSIDHVRAYQLADGFIYEGALVKGLPEGQGRLIFPNGDVYEGEFYEGEFEGTGTFISVDGWVYTGLFANNKPSGEGTYRVDDGTELVFDASKGQ